MRYWIMQWYVCELVRTLLLYVVTMFSGTQTTRCITQPQAICLIHLGGYIIKTSLWYIDL